jgi:four helix bundle protein
MDLAIAMHELAFQLPPHERFELGRDLRRTSRSIPSNVAEGFNRHSRASYRWHVAIALGSQGELETQLEIAKRLDYLTSASTRMHIDEVNEIGRMLNGLWRALGRR